MNFLTSRHSALLCLSARAVFGGWHCRPWSQPCPLQQHLLEWPPEGLASQKANIFSDTFPSGYFATHAVGCSGYRRTLTHVQSKTLEMHSMQRKLPRSNRSSLDVCSSCTRLPASDTHSPMPASAELCGPLSLTHQDTAAGYGKQLNIHSFHHNRDSSFFI